MPLDLKDDTDLFDGQEAVTIVKAGPGTEVQVSKALRQMVTSREAEESKGVYDEHDVKFQIGVKQFSNAASWPAVGDFVKELDDEVWTVLGVDLATLKTRLRCWSRSVKIEGPTAQLVDVLTPTWEPDESGAPVATWAVKYSDVEMKIEAAETTIIVRHDRKEVRVTHRAYVEGQYDIEPLDKVKLESGKEYHVIRVTGREKLGKLMVLDLVDASVPEEDQRHVDGG